ncbi:double zinc ribbon domain-containing protein [Rhodovibrionaceae bacterium A322]
MRPLIAASSHLLDRLLPPSCYLCQGMVESQGLLCGSCWSELTFIGHPCCQLCALPFELEEAAGSCADCLRHPPDYDHARAVLRYDDASRPLILKFKHGDRLEAARSFARWLQRPATELLGQRPDFGSPESRPLVVPVPLHWRRLFSRRYNQSALMGQALARSLDLPFRSGLLRRHRATASQGHLSRKQRQLNLRGAFSVPQRARPVVSGAWIMLVDDVLTSGATSQACARALKKAGAQRVDLLTLARV